MPRRRRPPAREEDTPYQKHLKSQLPVHRRLGEVLASATDPHPRKTRRIQWVGDYNPYDDPRVLANLLMRRYTAVQKAGIQKAAAYAKSPRSGSYVRVMEAAHDHRGICNVEHLGRSYWWSKLNGYICDVDYRDVDTLLGHPKWGREFRDLDDPNTPEVTILVPDAAVFKLIAGTVMHMDRDKTAVPNHMRVATTTEAKT